MKPNPKDNSDFARITQILRKQQMPKKPEPPTKLLLNKNINLQQFNSQINHQELQKTDRKKRVSPSPQRILKKDPSSLSKNKSKEKEKDTLQLRSREQIKLAERAVEKSHNLDQPYRLKELFQKLQGFPALKVLFQKVAEKVDPFLSSFERQQEKLDYLNKQQEKRQQSDENQQEMLQTFIIRQNKSNSEYLYEQLQLLMQENEQLKLQIGQSRKERLERMRFDELLLEQMRNLNINVKKKEPRDYRINLDKVKAQQGFHQEFMDQMEQFSESWRQLAKENK